jgi:hypothetical protein
MTDTDIVERLRKANESAWESGQIDDTQIFVDASNEIKKLRKQEESLQLKIAVLEHALERPS